MSAPVDAVVKQRALPASEIAVGHCVILNYTEQPCGKLLAVIVGIEPADGSVACKYLNASTMLDQYNKQSGMVVRGYSLDEITPAGRFGVDVMVEESAGGHVYWCQPARETSATYRDGERRLWQERGGPIRYGARSDVLQSCPSV